MLVESLTRSPSVYKKDSDSGRLPTEEQEGLVELNARITSSKDGVECYKIIGARWKGRAVL